LWTVKVAVNTLLTKHVENVTLRQVEVKADDSPETSPSTQHTTQ